LSENQNAPNAKHIISYKNSNFIDSSVFVGPCFFFFTKL